MVLLVIAWRRCFEYSDGRMVDLYAIRWQQVGNLKFYLLAPRQVVERSYSDSQSSQG